MGDAERLGVGSWRIGVAVAFVATTVPFVFLDRDWWTLTAYFALFAAIALLTALYDPRDVVERGTLRADPGGLAFRGRWIRVGTIRRARIRQDEKYAELDVDLGAVAPRVRFRVRTADAARAVVKALALDASRARDRFRLTSGPAIGWALTALLMFGGQMVLHDANWAVPFFLAAAAILISNRALHYADVGPDGVFLRKGFGRTHIRARDVLGVGHGKVSAGLVQLRLFRVRGLPLEFWAGTREAAAFETRVAELRAGVAPTGEVADCARILQSMSLDDLRALAVRPHTFRYVGVDRSALEQLLQDPFAAPRSRLRAAIALGSAEQLRVAVEQTTIPELRVALEQTESDPAAALATIDRIKG